MMKGSSGLIIGILVIAVLILAGFIFIREADDGPLEDAAESVENAVDDAEDEIRN